MKLKRLFSGVMCAVMACSMPSAVMAGVNAEDTPSAETILSYDFEDGDTSAFSKRGDTDSSIIKTDKDSDPSHGTVMLVTGREKNWNGPQLKIDDILNPNEKYMISVDMKASWYNNLTVSMQYNDASGETKYSNLTSAVSQGEWVSVEQFKFSYSDEWSDVYLYIEANDGADIWVDNFVIEAAPSYKIQEEIPSLKDVFSDFKFGTAATASELAPQSTKDLINKHFNSITAGNELKPDAILDKNASLALAQNGDDTNPQISLASARSILDFARDNNISVRGHVLVWHQQTPLWFFKENYDENGEWVSKEKMLTRLENYIKNVFTAVKEEYPDVDFYAWDVVNECLKDNGEPRDPGFPDQSNGYQSSPWVQIFGDNSFIKPAFEFAKKYAPEGTKLYYNDYNEYMDKKSAIVALTEEINADGHYIDGIGMQSHLDVRNSSAEAFPSVSVYKKALDMFTNTGLDVQITELDATVNDKKFDEQAKYYGELFDAIMEYKDKISAVVLWGTTDDQSWRSAKTPLLFNEDYSAKEAFYAITDGREPATPTETTAPAETTTTNSETTTTGSETTTTAEPSSGITDGENTVTIDIPEDKRDGGYSIVLKLKVDTSKESELKGVYISDGKENGGFGVKKDVYTENEKECKYVIIENTEQIKLTLSNMALYDFSFVKTDEDTPSDKTLYGDANLDGEVTVADAVAILQYLANGDEYALDEQAMTNADCCDTGDGVNTEDALAVQKLDAKVVDSLPITLE